MKISHALAAGLSAVALPAAAQQGVVRETATGVYIQTKPGTTMPQPLPAESSAAAPASALRTTTLPVNSLVEVTPASEISSKNMREGTTRIFLVVNDVEYQGAVIIPRGSPVEAKVTWRTGKGIVGKSAKFELSFDWVRLDGKRYRLRGMHRQEGRGNTAGALLGAAIITGKSATMIPGQIVNVFTAAPIVVERR